ncbi:putative Amino acid transporter [Taphrina deformans PYCC 5710]|uniref:Amino acid transporter n=1 Tax=Taphrina deformans (strain PYCC 5710 / ATCC 11124 / CBS 356.35 / IMI 108563 / JCM 9778 / NBRC 8474) TaxID=1097556 RepID=R4XAN0_TAPDE|nr:putative Amino acid transporter [Taphrina deformans PYCC 5710]|eukprot:CCG82589.1 putative Amino acid transporter [Taphrina deformans PYCC 5710]
MSRQTGVATKVVTFRNGLGLVIGLQIGSGIFSTPGLVAQVGSPGASILVWIASGLLAWTGASSYAELGSSLPFNGGSHAYLQHIYGDLAAFLFSWTGIIALKPGSGAIISIITAEYINDILFTVFAGGREPPRWLTKLIALLCAALVSVIVGSSTRAATRINDFFTFTKIITLMAITGIGFVWLGLGHGTDVYRVNPFSGSSLNGGTYALALYSGLWAFDGWDNCSYVANEMINPARDIPRVVHVAQPIVITAYVLANLSYFAVLPLLDIQKTHAVALDFGNAIFGTAGGLVFAVAVICSSLGALLSSTFTTARLVAVSGEQKELPAAFGRLHPRTNTPINAILLQLGLMSIYIAVGDFERLVTFYGVSAWIFFFATVFGSILLRIKQPDLIRPYKTWLATPIVFCCVALFLVVRGVFEAPKESGLGIMFISLGVPAYVVRFGTGTVPTLRSLMSPLVRLFRTPEGGGTRAGNASYRNI